MDRSGRGGGHGLVAGSLPLLQPGMWVRIVNVSAGLGAAFGAPEHRAGALSSGAQGRVGEVGEVTFDETDAVDGREIRFLALKKVAMAALTAFVTVNIWTGAPVLAIWVGAQASDQSTVSMGPIALVVVVLAVLVFALAKILTWLNDAYDEMIGRPRFERRSTWLRSMRGESGRDVKQRSGITTLEVIVVANVYVAFTALMVWYVFFSGSPFAH
jgi:hypothetical protein